MTCPSRPDDPGRVPATVRDLDYLETLSARQYAEFDARLARMEAQVAEVQRAGGPAAWLQGGAP